EARNVRDGQREGSETGPFVQADEDERTDAGREQSRHEHDSHQRASEPGGLHEEKRTGNRRAKKCADGREAAGSGDHGDRHGGGILLEQVHCEEPHSAPDRDEGRLRPENYSQAQRGEGGDDDAWQLDRLGGPAHLEALGRFVARGPRQVLDGEPDQQAAQREWQERPPDRLAVEPKIIWQCREDELLSFGDELQEEVRDRSDGHAEDGPEHQQRDVATAPQKLGRVGRCRRWWWWVRGTRQCASSIRRPAGPLLQSAVDRVETWRAPTRIWERQSLWRAPL